MKRRSPAAALPVSLEAIIVFPEPPDPRTTLHRICTALRIPLHVVDTEDVAANTKARILPVYWQDATYRQVLRRSCRTVNGRCTDISKSAVADHFEAIFGYPLAINPITFHGDCVCKSDQNATHDGAVVEAPLSGAPEPGKVYHRLVDNRTGNGLVEDLRVPVFRNLIPFVYRKRRSETDRFGNANTEASMTPVSAVLSAAETQRLTRFSRRIGMEFGELDVLRDRLSGWIYIVDANSTPFGPPSGLPADQTDAAVRELAAAFRTVFLEGK